MKAWWSALRGAGCARSGALGGETSQRKKHYVPPPLNLGDPQERAGWEYYTTNMTEMSTHAPFRPIRAAVLLAAALLLLAGWAGCGEGEEASAELDYEKALAGAPAPLATLHDQGNELLGGGVGAYRDRLKALRGYPVVVNKWASWCGPCRFEFPAFQRMSARFGKRVAFLGVDSDDSEDAAATFLEQYPVPYPSYSDPDQEIAEEMTATLGFPSTAFYDRSGELVYLKQGPYANDQEFLADIQRYALDSGS